MSLQVSVSDAIIARFSAPASCPAKSAFLRFNAIGRIVRSTLLLSGSTRPNGDFQPELIHKGQTRIDGLDDKIISLYAAGLTVRDIRSHLEDVYGLKVSADLISRVTDAVPDEVRERQSPALDRMYPIVIFDALRVKIRDADSGTVQNKAVYVAPGVTP